MKAGELAVGSLFQYRYLKENSTAGVPDSLAHEVRHTDSVFTRCTTPVNTVV